jgi:hypothetical protein
MEDEALLLGTANVECALSRAPLQRDRLP